MQRSLLVLICKINLFFLTLPLISSNQSTLQASQVRDVVKNIAIVTELGQDSQEQVSKLDDLGKYLNVKIPIIPFDIKNSELKSIAFGSKKLNDQSGPNSGGYTFIANAYNPNAGVSLNILKELLPLDFKEMTVKKKNKIYVGLFGVDKNNKLLPSLSNKNLKHLKLYIFKNDKTLLGSRTVHLNKYYSQTQQKFTKPDFSTMPNFECFVNENFVQGSESYPYLIKLENISGINTPNRYLNFEEISSPQLLPSLATSASQVGSFYQSLDSLDIIIGDQAFSFDQTVFPANIDMQLVFAAVSGGDLTQDLSEVDHYLLYIFDQNRNLIKAVHVDPQDAQKVSTKQSANGITVLLNGQPITQGQQVYPAVINLTYGAGIPPSLVSSIKNKITLQQSETLSSLVYTLETSGSSQKLDLSNQKSFGADWLDLINGLLGVGQTILLNTSLNQNSLGYVIFTAYAWDSTTSNSFEVAQQWHRPLSTALSNLTIQYETSSSKTLQTLSASNLQDSWIAIIPPASSTPASQALTKQSLSKFSLGALQAILSIHKNPLYSVPVTSYVTTQNVIPGWYSSTTQQYSGSGFNLQLHQMQSGNGYYFVEDNSGKTAEGGVAALDANSPLLTELENTIVPGGSCTMVFLAFDAQLNYIPDIIKTAPDQFGLFIFDAGGNSLSDSPVLFSADDYVGLEKFQLDSNASGLATFTLNGLGIQQPIKTLTYPFALKVKWNVKSSGPTPTAKTIPTSVQIKKASMLIPITQGQALSEFGCLFTPQNPESFDTNFLNTIKGKLTTVGDSVKIKISTSGNTVTATAYVKNKKIGTSQPITLPTGSRITYLLYTIPPAQEMELLTTLILGYTDIWLEFKVVPVVPPSKLTYDLLTSLALQDIQQYITLSYASIKSLVDDETKLPGWLSCDSGFSLVLNQMASGDGYAFVQDPWNRCLNNGFSGTSGIAGLALSSAAYQSMLAQMQKYTNISLVLLGFDANNNYVSDILTNTPTKFVLLGYETTGKLVREVPISFSPDDYVGSGKYSIKTDAVAPAIFTFSGLKDAEFNVALSYPFNLNITWIKPSKHPKKPTYSPTHQSVHPYKIGTSDTAELWLAVNISGNQYLLMNNQNSGLPSSTYQNWFKPYLHSNMSSLKTLTSATFNNGIVFSLVALGGFVYVYVQTTPSQSGGQGTYLGHAKLNGITSLPSGGEVIWSGSFIQDAVTISNNQAFLFTSGSSWKKTTSITVPAYPWQS